MTTESEVPAGAAIPANTDPAPSVPSEDGSGGTDWDALFAEPTEVSTSAAPVPVPAEPQLPSAPTPPSVSPPPSEVPAPAPVAAPVVPAAAPVEPVSQVPPVQPPPTAAPAPTPAQPAPSLEEQRQQVFSQLENFYQVTPEVAAQIVTEPEKILPKLFAKMHFEMMASTMQAVRSSVPNMVAQYANASTVTKKAEEQFFSAWPQLRSDDPARQAQLTRIATTYRSLNPAVDTATMIREVGELATKAFGLTADPSAPPPMAPPPKPPGVGGAPVRQAVAPNANPFVALAEEILNDND